MSKKPNSGLPLRPPNVTDGKDALAPASETCQDRSDVDLLYRQLQQKALGDDQDRWSTSLFPPSTPFQSSNSFIQDHARDRVEIFTQEKESVLYGAIFQTQINWKVESDLPQQFNKDTVRLKYVLNANSIVCTVHFDPSGRLLAFADGRTLFLLESRDGSLATTIQLPQTIKQMDMHTRALRFTPDSQFLVVNCPNNTIEVFAVADGRSVAVLEGHEDVVSALAFTPDGKALISGGFDGMVCVWDLETFKLTKKLSHRPDGGDGKRNRDSIIVAIEVSFDGKFVAVAFMNGMVGIYDVGFATPMSSFAAHQKPLLNMAISRESLAMVTASQDMSVKCWNIGGVASCSRVFNGHNNFAITATFCLNEKYVLSGSKNETIQLWNRETGKLQCTIYAHQNTIFGLDHHPTDNAFVTCGGDGYVCYWEYELEKGANA